MITGSLVPDKRMAPPSCKCHTMPAVVPVALLVVELALLLSEGLICFFLDVKMQWPVLIAIASLVIAIVLILLWVAFCICVQQWFHFSIRFLLVLAVATAIPLGWLAMEVIWVNQQRKAIAAIENLGAQVRCDYEFTRTGDYSTTPPGPFWLRVLLGDYFFAGDVAEVTLRDLDYTDTSTSSMTDAGLENLKVLTRLQRLYLREAQITDAGLEHLKGLNRLKTLDLTLTHVTDEGVRKLQQALPDCTIDH
jgi:hypothetical protein